MPIIISILVLSFLIMLVLYIFEKNREKKDRPEPIHTIGTLDDALKQDYLFDFKNYAADNQSGFAFGGIDTLGQAGVLPSVMIGSQEVSTKIAIKPIDVLDQLETVPTPFDLAMLNEKIAILKDKEKLIVQKYAKREIQALIERLENRKKFIEHRSFFDTFQNTTDEKIDSILSKYDLVMKTSDIFVPEFPDEAIAVMKSYTEEMEKICSKKPVFYVIAEPDKFRKAYQKRDPILLVQSPFGFYWQILGAWDKEMLILSEL